MRPSVHRRRVNPLGSCAPFARAACMTALVAGSVVTVASKGAADPPPAAPPVPAFEAWAARQIRQTGHPGMALAVVVGDEVVFAHGYGTKNKWRRDPVLPTTVFRIASITKVLSGLALLQLRDAGKLSFDDTLASRLPEASALHYASPDDPPIRLRNLVTHSSGLPRMVNGSDATEEEMLAKLARVRVEFAPGTRTSYSNFAMGLVGPIVRRASGESYRDYMQDHVFGPLGMTNVAWEAKDVDPHLLSAGHERIKRKPGDTEDPPDDPPPWPKLEVSRYEWRLGALEPCGGVYTSVLDLAKLASFELSAWRTDGAADSVVLSRASLRESQTLALSVPGDGPDYGVNWVLEDDGALGTRVFHSGATDEYSGSVQMLPTRSVAVVLLSNAADPSAVEAVAKRILERAAHALDDHEPL